MTTISTWFPTFERKRHSLEIFQKRSSFKAKKIVDEPVSFHKRAVLETEIGGLVDSKQQALLLHGPRQKYSLEKEHTIPLLKKDNEVLVKILAIGLNPIDWKGPDYNFGIPATPWINGRDFAGVVVQTSGPSSRVAVGDIILTPSTDYRDIRKAAFQQYAVTTDFNAARIPAETSIHVASSVGVAFVAAALGLGVCLGADFSTIKGSGRGPSLSHILRDTEISLLPEDIWPECKRSTDGSTKAQPGDWLAIWGASTTTGYIALQLAKMCNLRVICITDVARHGAKLLDAGADLLVDRQDTQRAIEIIKGVTKGNLRFAVDIVGKETATLLQEILLANNDDSGGHLLGLTGLPKERDERITYHSVPIKLFHESEAVGSSLMAWLERLLLHQTLTPPEIVRADGGLGGINDALEDMRAGSISGKRVVISLDEDLASASEK